MENTYLQKVLRSLTKNEWRSLADFLASPYFNKNEKFTRFYQDLTPFFPDFAIGDDEKKAIYKNVSGGKEFNDASYRNLCSDLLELALEFLTQNKLQNGSTVKREYQTRALIDKHLYDLSEKYLKMTTADLERHGFDVNEKLRTEIWLSDMNVLLSIYTNRNKINASAGVMLQDETYKKITAWSLVKIYNSFLNYIKASKNFAEPPDERRITAFLELYEQLAPFDQPVVTIYYLLVKMTFYQDDSCYFEAKTIYTAEKNSIPQRNQENILIGLLDYANEKVSTEENWRGELFELYDEKFRYQLWNANKGLTYASVFNAFMNALQMNRVEYAEKLVEQNIGYLHPGIGPSILYLCHAWLYFHKGDTEKAHEELTKVETENLMIKYEMRCLQSVIYYEKKEWDVLGSYLESFRHFVMYNKSAVDSLVTKQFANFCKYFAALMKLEPYADKKEKEKLVKQITAEEHVYLRKWILDKLSL